MTAARLSLVRVAPPAAIAITGSGTLLVASARLGLALTGAATVVVFANALMRRSIASDEEHRDERARRFFDRTGDWPDEA